MRNHTAGLVILAALLTISPLAAQGGPSTDDLNAVAETPTTRIDWRGVVPGITTRAQALDLLGAPSLESRGPDGHELLYPPVVEGTGSQLDATFGRVARVVLGEDDRVAHVHIGGFFPDARPRLSWYRARVRGRLEKVAAGSRLNPRSTVWDAPDAGLWLIVSSIPDPDGELQVLAVRYYDPAHHPELPVARTPAIK